MKSNLLKILSARLICLSCLFFQVNEKLFAQVDGHIDPSIRQHKHNFTFVQHADSRGFTNANAKNQLSIATKLIQMCNNNTDPDQDVAVKVSFVQSGTVGSFGAAGDGLDIINTKKEFDQVYNLSLGTGGFEVKVVTMMQPSAGESFCQLTAGQSAVGCAGKGNSLILVASGHTDEYNAETIAHEFGHSRGLPHRDDNVRNIMHTNASGTSELNQDEAAKFHDGGVDDGPARKVDIAFLIDDTGSMGEEIAGVRNTLLSLLLNINSSTPGSSGCGPVYQLITYKDAGSPRPPTTDLNVIRGQVASLVASGGGDCPEGSMEALADVYESIVDKGTVYHATDASPHAGTEGLMNMMVADFKLRGVKMSTLLSGDCISSSVSSSRAIASIVPIEEPTIPYSDNHDATERNTERKISAATLTVAAIPLSAIDIFSYMAKETGGVFAFLPEVNSGIPEYKKMYENIGYNIAIGAIKPAITHVNPFKGPIGGIIALTINATNSNFNSSSILSFADPSIVVKNLTVASATQIFATIEIAPGTALGLKDIKVNTTLEDGQNEVAEGIGIFNVIGAPTIPTVLSISPLTGRQGEKLTVRVTGSRTHWDNSSVLTIGNDITILKTTVLSNHELLAEIKVPASAAVGYRNVTVRTGSEIASENEIGPFLVIAAPEGPINEDPVANGWLMFRYSATSVLMNAWGSFDPEGGPITFKWEKVGGPETYSIIYENSSTPIIYNLVTGTYTFRLTVTDDQGATDTSDVTFTIKSNLPPIANGWLMKYYSPTSVLLNAWGSYDPEGGPVKFSWRQASGPAPAHILYSHASTPVISNLVSGVYHFELTVTDQEGASSTATVAVTINTMARIQGNGDVLEEPGPTGRLQIGGLSLYPNPVNDNLNYSWTDDFVGKARIAIIDQSGKVLKTVEVQKNTEIFKNVIAVTDIKTGMYRICILRSDGKMISQNFLKR